MEGNTLAVRASASPLDEKPEFSDPQHNNNPFLGEESIQRYNSVAAWLSFSFIFWAVSFIQPVPTSAQSTSDNVIYLNQAWSQEDRDWSFFLGLRRHVL
jgi:hypothetical protein